MTEANIISISQKVLLFATHDESVTIRKRDVDLWKMLYSKYDDQVQQVYEWAGVGTQTWNKCCCSRGLLCTIMSTESPRYSDRRI